MEAPESENVSKSSKKEHEIKLYEQKYHGVNIKIVEFDHGPAKLGDRFFQMPKDWREKLDKEIYATEGFVAPEYCMPDLEANTFREPLSGWVARQISSDFVLQITSFFGHISKRSGFLGRSLIATDIANTGSYALFEAASMMKLAFEGILRDYISPNIAEKLGVREMGYKYGDIKSGEYKISSSNDARHLVSARGLMQKALLESKDILGFWAPHHAERIHDYINRQKEIEERSEIKVDSPVTFKDISPKEESKKMVMYGRPPLQRSIREYAPMLRPELYQLDLEMNKSKDEINLNQLTESLETQLKFSPTNEYEKKVFGRMKKAKHLITNLSQKPSITDWDYKELGNALMTDKFGWKLKKKTYIY